MPASPWLSDTHDSPVEELDINGLLDSWQAHRNDLRSVIAAEEVMRRLCEYRASSPGSLSAVLDLRRLQPSNGVEQG